MVRFDDSLPALASVVASVLGAEILRAGTVLRDAAGCLAFFAPRPLAEEEAERLTQALRQALGPYARPDRVVAGSNDYGAAAVSGDASAITVGGGEHAIRLVDRRLVGADWLRAPAPPASPPPRVVFTSIKGGVGRSTALAVVAAHQASRSRRVLAIDLDLEAPGLGALLLTPETSPEFGMIDALVEGGLAPLDDAFLADLISPSEVAGGRIDVLPAIGARSLRNPADVLAKLARAYAEKVQPDGSVLTILDQVRVLVDRLAEPARYDVVLIDARAGLHETTASSVLGLGAEVLLFGLDEPQTFQGYAMLLAHLARLAPPDAPIPEWISRLTMVQGKAAVDAEERAGFVQRCQDLFVEVRLGFPLLAAPTEVPVPGGSLKDVPWDDEQPDEAVLPAAPAFQSPLAVLLDSRYQGFDPLRKADLLSEAVYRTTFGSLIDHVSEIVAAAEEEDT
jgi:MinD-like ATPase involved in chromosome partitioning or flagellar assembly